MAHGKPSNIGPFQVGVHCMIKNKVFFKLWVKIGVCSIFSRL